MPSSMAAWPMVALGEIATPIERPEVPTLGKVYRQVGVRLWGQGPYERESLDGGATQYKTLSRVETDDIIVNKIWARNGSVSLIPPDLEGCYVSGEFPTFAPVRDRLYPQWFRWLTKTRTFWDQCNKQSRGTSGKNRIRPEKFLAIRIPLPSLDEQQRIVACIEEMAARIEQARGLRREIEQEEDSLVSSLHIALSEPVAVRLSEILTLDECRVNVVSGENYLQVGVRSFGNGLFVKEAVDASRTMYKAFNRLYSGAVVLSQVKGWEGAVAVAGPEMAGMFVSPEYRTFRCIPGKANPEYMATLVAVPWFWTKLQDLTRGVGARRERTRPEQFLQVELPMPNIENQMRAVSSLHRLEELKQLQEETQAELNALLPSVLDKAFRGEL